jgi:hypothetical protein
MKKFAILLLTVLAVWAIFNRHRIFVRDPRAAVYRNKVKQTGEAVYINSSNEILLEKDGKRTIVQNWDMMAATPAALTCVRWMACLTGADHAPTLPVEWSGKGPYDPHVVFNGRIITFVDVQGVAVRVEL